LQAIERRIRHAAGRLHRDDVIDRDSRLNALVSLEARLAERICLKLELP
jgi:hypothetical protein